MAYGLYIGDAQEDDVSIVRKAISNLCVVFFFQAEDGIRDLTVTGVQTCALPISSGSTSATETCQPSCSNRSRTAGPEVSCRVPAAAESEMVRTAAWVMSVVFR